ncbi:plant intracell Ras-group-related LRR protein 6-like [Dorcoceras hygrometricum]|uniref:Plant intracell Ras-group-related LRR protein 6-like n=1 Tax=Dorcoceras hygrometricum TaxID=472368 RepID=A0A2Z7B502_9LAMI|nr:plant intracell Ras-group-related LRR protein 6-like [Dorcoceras hygrometricum]
MYEQKDILGVDYGRRRQVKRNRRAGVEEAGEKLEIVDLSGMCLATLPKPPMNLATICKLDLSNNHLQNIPESLTARLLNVVTLDVRSNQLKTLPNSIGCLSKLKVLNVSANFLHSLPRTIENCRSLEELNANFNQLTQLPDTIGFELVNLRKLCVNSNKLIFLPHSTSHLTNLQTLDARLNCLRSLPEDLENLVNLKILNVSQNFQYLTTLPYSVGLLMSLVELDVSYNKIAMLPESIGCLQKLKKLTVVGNPLVSPPMDVMEQGVQAVKEYLCGKINGTHKSSSKKSSWLGKLARCGTFSGRNIPADDREEYMMASYSKSFDGSASPGYWTMLSPRRLFSSPKSHFSTSKLNT